jgi:hypothetical protein
MQSANKRNPTKMKTTMKRSLIALVIAALAFGSLSSARAAVETYNIDPVHTWVGFSIAHFFTKVPGYFSKVKGTIVVDRDHLENSTVEAVMKWPASRPIRRCVTTTCAPPISLPPPSFRP